MARKKLGDDNPLIQEITTGRDAQEAPEAVGAAGAAESEPTERRRRGRPRRDELVRDNSPQEGLTTDYTRFSVICKLQNVKDLKDYAYTKRITLKDAIDEVIESFFQAYRSNPDNEPLLDHHTRGNK